MTTTIAVKERTLQVLAELKHELGTETMDEVIMTLVEKHKKLPRSLKGAFPKLKPMSEKDEEEVFDEF